MSRITADTNVLVRAIRDDHPTQSPAAQRLLEDAELIALPIPTLCELVWLFERSFRTPRAEVVAMLTRLLDGATVTTDWAAAEAGLAAMAAGADFADGVIAHQGEWLGGATFASFDRRAVKAAEARGRRGLLVS